jgi:hypothetical protein
VYTAPVHLAFYYMLSAVHAEWVHGRWGPRVGLIRH